MRKRTEPRITGLWFVGRSPDWLKMKNADAPAVKREAEEEWGKKKCFLLGRLELQRGIIPPLHA
jgi:hypothetical protein